MDIASFFPLANAYPWAYVAIVLTWGVTFVNGWTDGPNSIATCVTTRAMRPKPAVIMCAILNGIGTLAIGAFASFISSLAGGDVSKTIAQLVNWGDSGINQILCAISCGMAAIIIVSLLCTAFGFPSSQSNCLIGGLTGAGMAITAISGEANWFANIGAEPWIKVAIGFFGSLLLGFALGYGMTKLIQLICRKMNKGATTRFFNKGQIVTSGIMSFFHGIQDGAKFIGVSMLVVAMLASSQNGQAYSANLTSLSGVWWIYLPIAILEFAGTMVGGYNIIKTMGKGMAILKKYQAFATDIAASIGLLLATFFGLPVSTGTVKSTAIMGGGAARSFRRVRWNVAGRMVFWGVIVFPLSALAGFLGVLIFIWTC